MLQSNISARSCRSARPTPVRAFFGKARGPRVPVPSSGLTCTDLSPQALILCKAEIEGWQQSVRGRNLLCQSVPSSVGPTCSQTNLRAERPHNLPELPPLDDNYEQACTFSSFANWLIPGALMLGRYPYVEPSRCTSRKQGDDQLSEILSADIDTFVQLQAEIPPQTEFALGGKDGFLPYRATADLIQASREGPPPMKIVQGLRNPILDKFLPTSRKDSGVTWKPKELQFTTFPIVDLSVPEADKLKAFVKELQARLENGEALYVHCWGGRGRAGTVGAVLLASAYGLSADEALERVQRAYSCRQDPERSKSPETDEQFAFIRDLVATL